MSAGVSPVPDEAVEAGLREWLLGAGWDDDDIEANADDVQACRREVEHILTAALPFLREGIAAEVLGPVARPDYWAVRDVVNRGRHWFHLTDLAAENDARALMAALPAPVQAAECPHYGGADLSACSICTGVDS